MFRGELFPAYAAGVLVGAFLAFTFFAWRVWRDGERPVLPPSPPLSPPTLDLTTVMTKMIETNGRIQADMLERGLDAVTKAVERAAFGPQFDPEGPPREDLPPPFGPIKREDGPPWEGWDESQGFHEATDDDIPEMEINRGPRAVGVSKLPDFTGERLP